MNIITSANCWKDFEKSLEDLGTKEKGNAFEELTRLYLLTHPIFSTKFKKIWHHSDVPQKIVDELGLQRPEIGVDIIAQVKDGTYWAIQCKFHQDQTDNASYKELSTFFSITERKKTYSKLSHRLVCTSAHGVSHRVAKAHPEKLGYITSSEFTKLGRGEFDAFREILDGGNPTPKPYDPRPHQTTALDKCENFFINTKETRGKIIHPCGSGKSLTGYWISQRLNAKTILVAVPSLALVRQTLYSWAREAVANGIDMDWIAVCSDDDVKNLDDPLMKKVDIGIEVNTDPQIIANFLSKSTKNTKVVMTTYHSSKAVIMGVKKSGQTFDLGIYDEAHKTVGQKDKGFAQLLYDKNVKVKNRVFMTATERVFRGNSDEYLSMDNPKIYGTIIDKLSFKAALEQDPPILSDYKIVTTVVTKSEIEKLINQNDFIKSDGKEWTVEGDASTFASLIALRKLIKKKKLKHVVSFHSSIKRSIDFQNLNTEATKAAGSFGKLSTFHVSGKDSTGRRAAELERFVAAEPSLITNARCLNEGVDVPAIDGVLFADPKHSMIDIVQAAGRAMRKFDSKKFGYIIVPVILDEDGENPSDDAFNQIITVISALGMSDDRMIAEFSATTNKKSLGGDRIVEFDFPEIVRVSMTEFISNIEIQIWDRLSYGWVKGLTRLKNYISKNGNGNAKVPISYKDADGYALGTWCGHRRQEFKKGRLKKEYIKELEILPGWVWDTVEEKYAIGLKALKEYVNEYGDPFPLFEFKDSNGFPLQAWISTKRGDYKKGKLSQKVIKDLEAIPGWIWDRYDDRYNKGIISFKKYVKKYGNGLVEGTVIDPDGFNLSNWVTRNRSQYKKNKLSEDVIKELENTPGWVWNINEYKYLLGLNKLKDYVDVYKTSIMNSNCKHDGFKLGSWINTKRGDYKKGKLSKEIIKDFEELPDWTWSVIDLEKDNRLKSLNDYIKTYGDAKVKNDHKDPNGFKLGSFVYSIRSQYKKNKLSKEDINFYESMPGWQWDDYRSKFDKLFLEGLERLKIYYKNNDNSRVVLSYKDSDGFKLGGWTNRRRSDYQKDKLSKYQINQLEEIPGWIWNMQDNLQRSSQAKGIQQLKKYITKTGSSFVSQKHKDEEGFSIGYWIYKQREEFRKNKLDQDFIKELNSIKGWLWQISYNDEKWENGFRYLLKYKELFKEEIPVVIYISDDGFKLGTWVNHQRIKYRKNTLSKERIKRLESIEGWIWEY